MIIKIVTDCEELVLARMDVRLIMQVLVNFNYNAIKIYTAGFCDLYSGNENRWESADKCGR